MAGVLEGVTIKKEIEDPLDSPEQAEGQDSGQGQAENQSNQKLTKVWCEDEVRSLIELAKIYIPKFKDKTYTKKQLVDDISNELQMIGYDTTPDNVRSKMKYLRTRYRNYMNYNAKHTEKRDIPFSEELTELYSLDYFDSPEFYDRNGNGSSEALYRPTSNKRGSKSTIPASHVDLRTVVTSKKKTSNQIIHKGTKFAIKRKATSKSRGQPLFQCGLCMEKFKTSHDMHGHACKPVATKPTNDVGKKKVNSNTTNSSPAVFHWNSLITMQFLELMKDYQESVKSSNFRKGSIWSNMSTLMKRRGYTIHPKELEKKWNVLTCAFEKTMKYNKTHKDKKKCAFSKRLSDLYRHPSSFACFKVEEPVKMTVEVSPFSVASRDQGQMNSRSSANSISQRKSIDDQKVQQSQQQGTLPELLLWLDNTWSEWKELEKKREELRAQRHNEVMEMLSYLVENNANGSIR